MTAPAATRLPVPDAADAVAWVDRHLGDLTFEGPGGSRASSRFRGGQTAADAALATLDITDYARRRSGVWPPSRRGATGLSPYIRHGLVTLPQAWAHVADAPAADRRRFRDELRWQEYARHVYARIGPALAAPLRAEPAAAPEPWPDPWPADMACVERSLSELEGDGWLVNQVRMWLASQWTVRAGADWREGEDRFFRHLLDGSRAANRVGWQWTIGSATAKPYGFSRWQVRKRAASFCTQCARRDDCPIEDWPDATPGRRAAEPPALRADPDPAATGGPTAVERRGDPVAVWLTAESLGDDDPALAAEPTLPVVFVFDEALLGRLRLSATRLCFLAETLADLTTRREVEVWRGRPLDALRDRPLAATFTPVPGWRRLASQLDVAAVHPWPWLVRPHGGSARSFTAWDRATRPE